MIENFGSNITYRSSRISIRVYMFIYMLAMIHWYTECISRVYVQTNPMVGPLHIYRPVLCAATISVKCVTVEATAKASFDFSLVTINSWFMPLRVEYARSRRGVTIQMPSNHAWDRPVAKIGLAATVMRVGLFYFVRYIPAMQIGKTPSHGCQRNHREARISSFVASHLTSSLRPLRGISTKDIRKSF